MPSVVVSGRVDQRVREQAGAVIRAAGLTANDVIRRVWESIARTGEVPEDPAAICAQNEKKDALDTLKSLRSAFGATERLLTMTDEQMREEIAERYA